MDRGHCHICLIFRLAYLEWRSISQGIYPHSGDRSFGSLLGGSTISGNISPGCYFPMGFGRMALEADTEKERLRGYYPS